MTEPEVKSPPRAQAAAINSTVLFQELRNWKYDLLFVGLFVVGLSGGLLMVGKIRQRPDLPAGLERPPVPIACAEPKHDAPGEAAQTAFLKASAAMPVIPDVPKLDDASPKDRLASAPEENTGSRQILRLDSKSSVVVLGLEAAAVVELSEYPRRLGELIQNGSLFTVPSGTPIQIRERGRGIMKVEILEGAMAGRDGWTRSSHVTSRH